MNNIQIIKSNNSKSQSKPQSQSILNQRLGQILQQADLISPAQIELALIDQSIYQDLRFGEILALRGWIKQKTVDFFAEDLSVFTQEKQKKPLGFYLQKAELLNEKQIKLLLSMQNQGDTWIRLGKLVVMKGLLKPNTVEFFLENLSGKSQLDRVFLSKRTMTSINKNK
jgi:hypothetical protein